MTPAELTEWVVKQGQPAYRARQVLDAVYRQGAVGFEQIRQIPPALREALVKEFSLWTLRPVEIRRSEDKTVKYLSALGEEQIETVLIPAPGRNTVCASTQVGCAYACAFCASGLEGFRRNLTPGEIVQEILLVNRDLKSSRVSNVVFMGMGEPLANYDNLFKAIRILNDPQALGIGARKITISTVGLVPKIEQLSKEGLQIELAISLHAPNDELRGQIMPVNRRYPLKELIAACRAYAKKTKRLVTFEYILLFEVNDSVEHAQELAKLLKGSFCKVNLIPCHPIPGLPFKRPPLKRMLAFERALKAGGIVCTLRRSRGLDIEGACGQLRLRHEQSQMVKSEDVESRHDPHP